MTIALKYRSAVLRMSLCSLLGILAPPLTAEVVGGSGNDGGTLFAPADYLEIPTPVTDRITTNVYDFYLGNLRAGFALLEVSIKLWWSHLAVTPSYLFIRVPANGLALLTQVPQNASYRENQFRLSTTLSASRGGFHFAKKKREDSK